MRKQIEIGVEDQDVILSITENENGKYQGGYVMLLSIKEAEKLILDTREAIEYLSK